MFSVSCKEYFRGKWICLVKLQYIRSTVHASLVLQNFSINLILIFLCSHLYEGDIYLSRIEVLPRKNCFSTSQSLGEGIVKEGPAQVLHIARSSPKEETSCNGCNTYKVTWRGAGSSVGAS